MGKLIRFTLARDAQKRETPAELIVPLIPPGTPVPQVLVELEQSHHSEAVRAACDNFLSAGLFTRPSPDQDHPIWALSRWLRANDDRVSREDLLA